TAGVVGVIANLALWFGLHVLFGDLTRIETGPVAMTWPVWSSVNLAAIGLFMVSALMLLKLQAGLAKTLGVCALLGAVIGLMS
ncbi:MAG: chromate transporter, partial [Pseudomonadota bacterium]